MPDGQSLLDVIILESPNVNALNPRRNNVLKCEDNNRFVLSHLVDALYLNCSTFAALLVTSLTITNGHHDHT